MSDTTSVKVAVRVRPLVSHEIHKGCQDIVEVVPQNEQVVIKPADKPFTFNYVLGQDSPQDELYTRCVSPLLKSLFDGFNVTIFAYGQTGSGKTHSMGTAYNGEGQMGVIPRAVQEIYGFINDQFAIDFNVTVSFIELYREILYDLLSNKPREQCTLELREDVNKGVHIPNLTEISVNSAQDILSILIKGSQGRATASTNMNSQSSRSHSIFTVNVAMQHKTDKNQNKMAKLHLVDLAGSERPKKTGAQGTTFKEGVDINRGLFALGNVISALGDEKTQNGFIPYRESNLTRLLKDSLGGNSMTLMIACVSPADYNMEETLSTLRYADRARKIKNKPVINQDPITAEINDLKRQVKQLKLQIAGQGGPIISASDLDHLKLENSELRLKIKSLMVELSSALLDKTGLHEKLLILQSANEVLSQKLMTLKAQYDSTFAQLSDAVEKEDVNSIKGVLRILQEIQDNFNVLKNDQIKTEDEIRKHEETFTVLVDTARNSGGASLKDFQEEEESHTTAQMALNSELQTVSKQLMMKEELARQLATNTRYMIDETAMLETNQKIEALEKEKEELLQQLRNIKTQENSHKLSEQRRKRMLELEEQLKELKKRILEQSRLIKLKEKDEQKIKMLHRDIVAMKATKVELLKKMRAESDKFRSWKQDKERELARVKQLERKKETELAKMKVTHEKQKNVLKRKFEEAAALNKRLQNTLLKRKQAQDTRFTGKIEKISLWLKEELDMHANLVEAEETLAGLLEDRATLQHQLEELKNNSLTAESPEVKQIEEDIELRSLQIQDLQQKLLDSGEDSKSKTRFDAIQTMVEAKYALRSTFEHVADIQKEKVHMKRENCELQDTVQELTKKLQEITKEKQALADTHANHTAQIEKGYQEKVGILLMQMRGIKNEDLSPESEAVERCNIQHERIQHLEAEVTEKDNLIQLLRKKLEDIEKASLSARTPEQSLFKKSNIPQVKIEKPAVKEDSGETEYFSDLDLSLADDFEKDPDWRKTPLGKRVITERRNHNRLLRASQLYNVTVGNIAADNVASGGGSKRSSEGGCTCKTKCNTARCGCRKLNRGCGSTCKCADFCCENRDNQRVSSTSEQDDSSNSCDTPSGDNNDTFKKPRHHHSRSRRRPHTPIPRKFLMASRNTMSPVSTVDDSDQMTMKKTKKKYFSGLPR